MWIELLSLQASLQAGWACLHPPSSLPPCLQHTFSLASFLPGPAQLQLGVWLLELKFNCLQLRCNVFAFMAKFILQAGAKGGAAAFELPALPDGSVIGAVPWPGYNVHNYFLPTSHSPCHFQLDAVFLLHFLLQAVGKGCCILVTYAKLVHHPAELNSQAVQQLLPRGGCIAQGSEAMPVKRQPYLVSGH